jgi:hypothetical protein
MMFEQIASDAAAGRFDDWALSTVLDENVQTPVISKAEFFRLHAAAGIAATWPIGNAGLLHVYGYLLSKVVTPFGLKGDRWRNGELAGQLGLAPAGGSASHTGAHTGVGTQRRRRSGVRGGSAARAAL